MRRLILCVVVLLFGAGQVDAASIYWTDVSAGGWQPHAIMRANSEVYLNSAYRDATVKNVIAELVGTTNNLAFDEEVHGGPVFDPVTGVLFIQTRVSDGSSPFGTLYRYLASEDYTRREVSSFGAGSGSRIAFYTSIEPIPEASALALLTMAALGLLGYARRRRYRAGNLRRAFASEQHRIGTTLRRLPGTNGQRECVIRTVTDSRSFVFPPSTDRLFG